MKRFLVTILAVLYLGVSSGATVQFHYCMGKLVEWGLKSKNDDHCEKCGMKKGSTKNCCKTSEKQFKIDQSQKASVNSFHFTSFIADLQATFFNAEHDHFILAKSMEVHYSNAPPDKDSTPVFIRNCNFRI